MKWPRATLRQVAPPERADTVFADDDVVWQLSLDQIESQTGRILKKVRARAGDAGTSTFAFDEKHVLYSKLRPYLNKVVRPDEPGVATTELVPLRPIPGVLDADFLTFYLRSDAFVSFATLTVAGAKMPRMIMDKFWEHRIPVPAPREQRRIAELLEQADALRRQRADADGLAARILPALFRKMFGDPERNPRGWPVGPLKQLGKPCSGGAFPLNEQGNTEGEVPFIKVSDMNLPGNERFIRSANHYVSGATLAELGVRTAPAGTTVFPKIGAAIATNKKRLLTRDTAFDNNVQGVTPLKPESTFYLHAFFERFDLMRLARTTTLPSIRPTELAELPVPAPPLELQAEFGRIYEQTGGSLDEQAQSRAALETLFQTMLHRAFTGELTARWREAHMKELLAEMEQQARALAKS